MATIILGCDSNGVNDSKCQDTVAQILRKGGHSVKKLPIAAGPFANYSYSSAAKGKIGIYLIAAGTNSISDLYYGGTLFDYAYFGIRGDIPGQNAGKEPGFSTLPIGKDPDCSSYCNKIAGKTFAQMNKQLKSKLQIVGGRTPEEIGNNLLAAIGGGNASGGSSGSGGSSSSGGGSSGGNDSSSGTSNVSPLLQGEMTFQELVGEICNGIDLLFLCKRSTVVVTDFETIFAEAQYLRDNHYSAVSGEDIKLWQLDEDSYELDINQHGFYNTVYVNYNKGTVKETFDDFVRVYGEVPITYNDKTVDKTTAQMKAKAYLAAHLRDLEMTVNATVLTEPDIDLGDIVTLDNPQTMQNTRKRAEGLKPEFLFVKGVNTSWEGDGYIETDLEMQFSPTSPEKKEVPTHGTKNCSPSSETKTKSSSGNMVFNSCGVSSDKKYVLSIAQPSAGRSGSYSYNTTYATIFKNKCPRCGREELRWDSGMSGAKCITCGGYHGSKSSWGDISESEVSCNACCSDFCGTTGWEKDGNFSSRLTTFKKPVKISKEEKNRLASGNYSL